MNNAQINEQVYAPIRDLKQKFYECQSNDEWQELKKQLKALLATAKEAMDAKFYDQYSQGVINSITKIYGYKQKQFNKAEKKQFTPKSSYIFREAEGQKIIEFLDTLNKVLKKKYDI